MINTNVLAIDLAKNSFQVCKTDKFGRVIFNKALSRKQLLILLANEKQSFVAMESCGGTHYWCRKAKGFGHKVIAISARRVKAFRQGQKTDASDALAISQAALQPNTKPSRLLSEYEQCLQGCERIREALVDDKVALTNQVRGLLMELGIVINKGDSHLLKRLPEILEDGENGMSFQFRACLKIQYERLKQLLIDIKLVEKQINIAIQDDVDCQRLQKLEGIGTVNFLSLKIALGNPEHFKNGREAAACFGATPVQHSTGGKERIGSISKYTANKRLRSKLYLGAMAVINQLDKREIKTEKERWLKSLLARRGKKVAAIALVNKTIRTAYALLKNNQDYKPQILAA